MITSLEYMILTKKIEKITKKFIVTLIAYNPLDKLLYISFTFSKIFYIERLKVFPFLSSEKMST